MDKELAVVVVAPDSTEKHKAFQTNVIAVTGKTIITGNKTSFRKGDLLERKTSYQKSAFFNYHTSFSDSQHLVCGKMADNQKRKVWRFNAGSYNMEHGDYCT